LVENSGALIGQESGLVVFEDGKEKSVQRFESCITAYLPLVIASINQESLKKNEMTCFAVNERYLPLKTGQITHPV
jgi:hypothetical protein